MNIQPRARNGVVIAALFFVVFGWFATSITTMWYREDDLGQIIGGIIRSTDDLAMVLTKDERGFVVPVNYVRSKPNVISGFLRPLKNFIFTALYYLFGLEPYPYYYCHVFFHALNAALLTVLLVGFMPIGYASLAGLLFAFYPDISWMTWIAAIHNSLVVTFMLLALLMFVAAQRRRSAGQSCVWWDIGGGSMFLLSLLARENSVFFQLWLFVFVFLFSFRKGLFVRIWDAYCQTWAYFAASLVYIGWRFVAFGTATLDRTMHSAAMRLPILRPLEQWLYGTTAAPLVASPGVAAVAMTPTGTAAVPAVKTGTMLSDRLLSWLENIFFINGRSLGSLFVLLAVTVLVLLLLVVAYRRHGKLLLWLACGAALLSWQAVLAYPCARYLNTMYPFLIVAVVGAVYLLSCERGWLKKIFWGCGLTLCVLAVARGGWDNRININTAGLATSRLKQRYEPFFKRHSFPVGSRFVLLSSPFTSDIHHIFQYFLKDFTASVAFDLFTTVAENGTFGCSLMVRSNQVPLRITPIENGFRYTSGDKEHAGWWIRFSGMPIAWHEGDRGYRMTSEEYQTGRWYPCSLGKLYFYEKAGDFVTDFALVLDEQWRRPGTYFIAWDPQQGTYEVIDQIPAH